MNMRWGMSLRIVTTKEAEGTTLKVSGRLARPWIAELVRAFDILAGPIIVDISDVSFATRDGVDVLRGLIDRGAWVRGCPPYLVPQLYGSSS